VVLLYMKVLISILVGESKRAEVRAVFETVATQHASLAIPLR